MTQINPNQVEISEQPKRLLDRLKGVKPAGKRGWQALCPAHDDKTASLSITIGKSGKTLLHCHARCKNADILDRIGMEMSDLFPPDQQRKSKGPARKIIVEYNYVGSKVRLIEALESRTLFTATPLAWPLTVSQVVLPDGSTQLDVFATEKRNAITITSVPGGLMIDNAGGWSQNVAGSFGSILIFSGAGLDSLKVDSAITTKCIIYGGRNDTIQSGSGNDEIYAGPGKSIINGGAGDDTLVTISGHGSLVYGGDGFDNLWVGRSDLLMDVSQDETNAQAIHRIGSFMSFRLLGAKRPVKPSMALNGPRIPEPFAPDATAYAPTQGDPLFGPNGPAVSDIHQQALGDCYFLATLSSIANVDPGAMSQSIVSLGDGTYAVEFYRNGVPVYAREDGWLPVDATNTVVYGDLGASNSVWVALMEKAYAYFRTGTADYRSMDGGLPSEVYGALDFAYTDSTPTTESGLVQTLLADQQAGRAAVFGTNASPTDPQLASDHAYMVNVIVDSATGAPAYLQLRNPWGTDLNGDPTYDGYVNITFADAFASMLNYCSAAV